MRVSYTNKMIIGKTFVDYLGSANTRRILKFQYFLNLKFVKKNYGKNSRNSGNPFDIVVQRIFLLFAYYLVKNNTTIPK